jgi:hypothetical protein
VQTRIIRTFYDVLITDTTKINLLEIDTEFCESLDMVRLFKSQREVEKELVINFALLLLHHDKRVKLSDLVGYDLDCRDIISKRESTKLWDSINDLSTRTAGFTGDTKEII